VFYVLAICAPDTCPYLGQKCRVIGTEAVCECTCRGNNCRIPGEFCGTDGVTYLSYKDFDIARCQMQLFDIEKEYWGKCQGNSIIILDEIYCIIKNIVEIFDNLFTASSNFYLLLFVVLIGRYAASPYEHVKP